MSHIVRSIEAISRHLDLPFDPPPLAPSDGASPTITPPSASQRERELPPLVGPSHHAPANGHQQPPQQRRPVPEHDWQTQSGAEELLAQAYARFSPPFPTSSLIQQSPSSIQNQLPPPSNTSGFFGLLDDLDWSENPGVVGKARTGEVLDLVGSQDPRVDVVKSGIVPQADAEILVDLCATFSSFAAKASHISGC